MPEPTESVSESVQLAPSLTPAKGVVLSPHTALTIGSLRCENPTDEDLEVRFDPSVFLEGTAYVEYLRGDGDRYVETTITWIAIVEEPHV